MMIVKKMVYVEDLDKEVEVEVEIEYEEVHRYVSAEVTPSESREIAELVEHEMDLNVDFYSVEEYILSTNDSERELLSKVVLGRGGSSSIDGSLESSMKDEWWEEVRNKYSLVELENILGNRFEI